MSKEISNLVEFPGKTVWIIAQQIVPSFKNSEPEIPVVSEQFPATSTQTYSTIFQQQQGQLEQPIHLQTVQKYPEYKCSRSRILKIRFKLKSAK